MPDTTLLRDSDAVATIAVKDLAKAKKFYEDTLGLKPVSTEGEEAIIYKTGASTIQVYRSEYAGTNKATAVTWTVGSRIDDIVQTLKSQGVTFEHYEMPGMKLEGDVHVGGDMRIAWFKDPDGNIISLVSG